MAGDYIYITVYTLSIYEKKFLLLEAEAVLDTELFKIYSPVPSKFCALPDNSDEHLFLA